jgi:SAM-dependent methyltransferase
MHNSVYEFVARVVDEYELYKKEVLEIGSRNINGTIRDHFNSSYVGLDMVDGEDVDIVSESWDLPFPNRTFDVVVSCEMLEHDEAFWLTFPEVYRVLKTGGYFIVTTRGINFPYHEFPGDYWRFTEDGIKSLLENNKFTILELTPDPEVSGVFAVAKRTKNRKSNSV